MDDFQIIANPSCFFPLAVFLTQAEHGCTVISFAIDFETMIYCLFYIVPFQKEKYQKASHLKT